MKFTEETLEHAVIELFAAEDIPHTSGMYIHKPISEVLLKEDLNQYLSTNSASTILPCKKLRVSFGIWKPTPAPPSTIATRPLAKS